MLVTISRRPRTWGWCATAVLIGWIGGSFSTAHFSTPAQAVPELAPLTRLLIEDNIRQQIALYGMYADGDGAGGNSRNYHQLAQTLLTPDVVSEIYPANGNRPLIFKGRDIIANAPTDIDPERTTRIAGRHYLVNTVFDTVTPTTADTRTTGVYFDATRNTIGGNCHAKVEGECGGTPIKIKMWVYQMHWRKTTQGWQISRNVLRDDN